MVTYRGHRYAISAPAPCTSRFGGHRGSWRRSNGECSCDGQQGHPAHDRVGGWRDPVLLAGVNRDEGLYDARGYLQAFSSGGGALLEGVGRRADAALDLFHPSWARDPRQQRDATSRVTCVARLHPDRTRECRQAICARQRRGTEQYESCSDRWTSRPRCERSDTSSATASPQTGTGLRRGGFRRALLPVPRNTVVCLVSARPTAVFSLASPLDASPLGGGSKRRSGLSSTTSFLGVMSIHSGLRSMASAMAGTLPRALPHMMIASRPLWRTRRSRTSARMWSASQAPTRQGTPRP